MNVAQTTRLYFAAIYQRELRDLSQSLADLNEQLVGVIQRRQKAGQANSADVELARLQATLVAPPATPGGSRLPNGPHESAEPVESRRERPVGTGRPVGRVAVAAVGRCDWRQPGADVNAKLGRRHAKGDFLTSDDIGPDG